MSRSMSKPSAFVVGGAAVALLLAGCQPSDGSGSGLTELTFLVDNSETNVAIAEGLIEDFEAAQSEIVVTLETRPDGTEGDNIIKTRLATDEMADVFLYNSGSLFQALAPEQTLVDLSDEPYVGNVVESFQSVVSSGGNLYGVPLGTAMGGGVLYNKAVYEQLGLSVPLTWDDFIANSEAAKQAGLTGVIETFGETWTAQLLVLADFANVLATDPDWAEKYTANEVKYATDPVALAGFEHLEEVFDKQLMNADFGSASLDDGLRMVAEGSGVHFPMLTFTSATIANDYPELADDVGFFALPGESADDNALTTWMPGGLYIPQSSPNVEAAKTFLRFVASKDGCDSQTDSVGAAGPYLITGCELPDDVPVIVSDLLGYFESPEDSKPALEFLSPVKGPAMPQITVAVGSGINTAKEGAELYDIDVEKQAQQLGLEGW